MAARKKTRTQSAPASAETTVKRQRTLQQAVDKKDRATGKEAPSTAPVQAGVLRHQAAAGSAPLRQAPAEAD